MRWLGVLLLFAGMLAGLLMIPFGLSGVAVILGSIGIYAFLTHFGEGISLQLFLILCVLTVVAETSDNWLVALGARKFGASRTAVWLSFVGGMIGSVLIGLLLAPLIGILAPFVGAFTGSFLIVFVYEYRNDKGLRGALRAGWGTVLGRTAGVILKMAVGFGMILTVFFKIIW
ncbi:MAG: DUF456 domain-containing protein [Terriglobia bacterium]